MVVALSGFMGSGKSCVGRELSKLLGLPSVDLDLALEQSTGRRIPEIFASEGEAGFRDTEAEVLAEVLNRGQDMVLALGGGTLLRECNRALVARHCICVYLRASEQTLRQRLFGTADASACSPDISLRDNMESRPLLRGCDFPTLLAGRIPIYEKTADIIIDTDGLSPDRIALMIAEALSENDVCR